METIKKLLFDIVIGVWFIIAFFATMCLLSYNDFGVSVFGKNTVLIIDSDELEPEYLEGDLLIVKRTSDSKINIGDTVFYYNSAMNTTTLVYRGIVEDRSEYAKTEYTYKIDGENVSSEYVIGSTNNVKAYHKVGTFLSVITSQWGFLFFVLFPMLFAIIYEIMMIVDSNKKNKKESRED